MKKTIEEKFWEKVDVKSEDQCWPWLGCKSDVGYGQYYHGEEKKMVYAHRLSAKWKGLDIENKVVMHSCDNPQCVNPNHLSVGTHKDNTQDMIKKGRHKFHHKLSEKDVEYIKLNAVMGSYGGYGKRGNIKEIANKFNVTTAGIRYVLNKR